ncbi:homologous-pairing protein 2 homolog [Zerene cesonia]|uniref:homologous-pairing protein 2 homolog n=1 Tax=Zerene cesonia TaxID=33412 RepID=UPI0018E50223|nr:homologous-pairing protein 2 homolog [Zerene cesonia]
MANEAVLKYLEDTNRPYSCADVTVNLRGAYTKGVVQKTLDALSEAGKIKCKLYGKQKVYAAIQLEVVDGSCDIEDYDAQLKTLSHQLEERRNNLKTVEIRLKNLLTTPTSDAAKKQIDEINTNVSRIESKLTALRDSVEVVGAQKKRAILNEHEKYLREYRKRKRICSDMIETVLDGYPKSKKNFLEELCVETDEMVNFKLST